jgi:polysaccharide export outer membrane protein
VLPPPTPASAQPSSANADYRIGPLDLLTVTAQHVPELTAVDARVSGSGVITLPLVGDVVATGRSAEELQRDIADKLDQYLQAPQVMVFIKEYASQRVTVEGEVNQPGIFPIQGRTTLLQALALAHGTTQVAKLQNVAVFRSVDGKMLAAAYNLKDIRAGKQPDPEVYGNDLIEVDTSRARQMYRDFLQAVPFIALLRP